VVLLVLVPLTICGGDRQGATSWSAGVSATLGIAAYTGLFVTLGVRVKRSLLWGLLYIFIWEGFVARAGDNASRLAIRAYTRSVLSDATGYELKLADVSTAYRYIVPIAVLVLSPPTPRTDCACRTSPNRP
jgi:ABC-2 type transport system permease protein